MSRSNRRLRLVFYLVSWLAWTACAPAADRPNIVFFLADDHRHDVMGCAGHEIVRTPNLDELARRGVRFRNAFVTTSICAASRASILTGLHERTHKFTFRTPPIARQFTNDSYPKLLKDRGYKTGFVGKFGVSVAPEANPEMFDYFVPLSRSPYFKKRKNGSERHVSQIAGDRAIEFLGDCKPQQPFCLSISFNAPHAEDGDKQDHFPWPKVVDGWYDDVTVAAPRLSDPAVFEAQPDFLKASLNRIRWFWRWDTPEKYQKNIKAYYRMISGIDHVMGRVIDELDRLGFAENTVVIFMGDNGYYAGSRGFAGKWSHYEESLRVPLIVFDPRLEESRAGHVVDAVSLNIDIAPTIVQLAGQSDCLRHQGASLLPLVRGEQVVDWRKDFFCEHLFAHKDIPKWEGVRGPNWVYARYFEQEPPFEFLHDLQTDPDQLKNHVSDARFSAELESARSRCDQLRDAYGGTYSREKFPVR